MQLFKFVFFLFNVTIFCFGCSKNNQKDDTLIASKKALETRDDWSRARRPLEIKVLNLAKEALSALKSLNVIVVDDEGEVSEKFKFNGEVFLSSAPLRADSLSNIYIYYPNVKRHYKDTLLVSFPLEPVFIGIIQDKEKTENIKLGVFLEPVTSTLRLKFESDNLRDIIDEITLEGDNIYSKGIFLLSNQTWLREESSIGTIKIQNDEILNSNRYQDVTLLPSIDSRNVIISLKLSNKKEYKVNTMLPALDAGEMVELTLSLKKDKLSIKNSWLNQANEYTHRYIHNNDSVSVGQFLQEDGSFSLTPNSHSLAWVLSSKGKHGVAIAMEDNDSCNIFGKSSFKTGKIFKTADGEKREGNFTYSEDASTCITFSPNVHYPDICALGYDDGPKLMNEILSNAKEKELTTFRTRRKLPSAYIPSLCEMARLAFYLESPNTQLPAGFHPLKGSYATLSESGEETFYSIDMDRWFITAFNSKDHARVHTRLFYLF